MLTGEIPFLSKGLQDEVRKKYEGHIVFAVGTSDYSGKDHMLVADQDGEWLYICGSHSPSEWTQEGNAVKMSAMELLTHLQDGVWDVNGAWQRFIRDDTGNKKHSGPSYSGLIGMLKFDLGMEA